MIRILIGGMFAAAVAVSPALATQFVTNGNFSQTTATGSRQMSDDNGTQYVTGWTNANGYNFIIKSDPTVANSVATNNYGPLSLWGKYSNGADSVALTNGLSESSAAHGNFLAADGAFGVQPIYQQVSGLTAGRIYDVTFDWAGAQQQGYNGDTTEGWYVGLGTDMNNFNSFSYAQTPMLNNVSHGFTGWRTSTYSFTATQATQYLAFMATGTPNGLPPFSLLDNVSMTDRVAAVPEPATWAMMIGGFGLIGASLRRRTRVLAH